MNNDVAAFWDAARAKWPKPVPPLTSTDLHDQLQLIQAINTILYLLSKYEQKNKQT